MAYSYTAALGDGSTTTFTFSFAGPDEGYYDEAQVKVYVNLVETERTLSGPNQITLSVAPAPSAAIMIVREPDITDTYTNFARGNNFGKDNLNHSFQQNLYLIQRIQDGFYDTGSYLKQHLNMGGHSIINGAEGEHDNDFVTLHQSRELIEDYTTFLLAHGTLPVFTQDAAGAVSRDYVDKMRDLVSLKDFGAVGTGVHDDSAAILSAVAYIETTGRNVYVPPGVYLTDPFTLQIQTYNGTGSFYGNDRTRCEFKRKTDGSDAFITFGALDGTIFRSHVGMSGIKVNGGAKTNGPAVEAFSLSRSNFNDCHFSGGTAAFRMYGGVSVAFQNCLFDMANRGIHIQDYNGANANKWPNLTKITGGEIVDNAEYGVWFDGGVLLLLDGVDIEGNGTTRGAANGGVYVGPNVGTAITSTSGSSPGVIVRNCWVERNKGIAQIYCESGINQIYSSFFFANGVDCVQYDIHIKGGRYTVKDCDFVFFSGKTAQISQGPDVAEGNYIEIQPETTYVVDSTKTCVNTGTAFSIYGGGFPAVHGVAKPMIQVGTDTSGVANPTITFDRAFKSGSIPRVFCQTTSSSQLTIYNVDVYNVSSVGFTLRKKQFDGKAISPATTLEVRWMAIGEAA